VQLLPDRRQIDVYLCAGIHLALIIIIIIIIIIILKRIDEKNFLKRDSTRDK